MNKKSIVQEEFHKIGADQQDQMRLQTSFESIYLEKI